MLLYEVSATVQPRLVDEYERYMREQHIPEVLATGCFVGAVLWQGEDNRYRIAYAVADEATLERYLRDHAPALRADFTRQFSSGVDLTRGLWRELQRWA